MKLIINNTQLIDLIKNNYNSQEIQNILDFLKQKNTFSFKALDNHLFSASAVNNETAYTGYYNVWVRDNIYVSYTHYLISETDIAVKNVETLLTYFTKYQWKLQNIIDGKVDANNVMERPHIRFNGESLSEIDQQWEHAQNDALGYFLWFYCKLAREGLIEISSEKLQILTLFPFYFQAIKYWQDEDSGHWEEERKIAASSIGVVIAGLKSFKSLLIKFNLLNNCQYKNNVLTLRLLDELIDRGELALNEILPAECIQPGSQFRKYDAALLFLIFPLQVVNEKISELILQNVINNLQGDCGVRRYLKDSFWCRDYQDIPKTIRTDISSKREQWLREHNRELKEGEEAQWCIFDPILSIIYGLKWQKTGKQKLFKQQINYLNRSLGQLTGKECPSGEFKSPEIYYLQNNRYLANDATPLLWTQANLRMALQVMQDNLLLMESRSL